MAELTVLYNAVCPVCREGICHFERRTKSGPEGVVYVDVSSVPGPLREHDLHLNDVRRKLHVVTPDGALLAGWPAISALWQRTPGWGWLARLGDLPGVRIVSGMTYSATAQLLWWWNRASGRW
jgi:predicted DCC family thiol-disulfide oxidoreductase YuxK